MAATTISFEVGPARRKWVVEMLTERVSRLSDTPIAAKVFGYTNGQIVNPLSFVAEFSFTPTDMDPATWLRGTWDVNEIGEYVMQISPGPSGAALSPGRYFVWTRITPTDGRVDVQQPSRVTVE